MVTPELNSPLDDRRVCAHCPCGHSYDARCSNTCRTYSALFVRFVCFMVQSPVPSPVSCRRRCLCHRQRRGRGGWSGWSHISAPRRSFRANCSCRPGRQAGRQAGRHLHYFLGTFRRSRASRPAASLCCVRRGEIRGRNSEGEGEEESPLPRRAHPLLLVLPPPSVRLNRILLLLLHFLT